MAGIEVLKCDAAQEFITIAHRPERDVLRPERVDVECVNAFGWRVIRHALQMLAEQHNDISLVQPALGDVHSCAISSEVKR